MLSNMHNMIYPFSSRSPSLTWAPWSMVSRDGSSSIAVPGRPLHVAAAYSGRIACAYVRDAPGEGLGVQASQSRWAGGGGGARSRG